MQIETLPYNKTNLHRPIILDYLADKPSLKPFYNFRPGVEGIEQAIQKRTEHPVDRNLLSDILLDQYASMDDGYSEKQENELVIRNIERLRDKKTFTVTTGHQLVIFGGPLFYIYKIISTIRLARDLKEAYPQYDFVPVYWMGTEDHDFEEISKFHLFGTTFNWDAPAGGPVGNLSPHSLKNLLEEVTGQIREKKDFEQSLGKIWNAAFEQPTLAAATRYWINELLRSEGLVVLDPAHPRLKQQFIPVMEADLFEHVHHELVDTTIEQLESYNTPVNPREINLFYIDEGLRERIVQEEGKFKVMNTGISFEPSEMKEALKENPGSFSPNVVLRPVYQEMILPNLAYVGGTNEISYWFELKGIFDQHKVFFPQLVVRNSALWIGGGIHKKLKKYGLEYADLFLKTDDVVRYYLKEKEDTSPFDDKIERLEKDYHALMEECKHFSNDLKWPVINQCKAHLKDLGKLQKDTRKLMKQRNEKDIQQIHKIFDALYPDGNLQERHENFIPYYLMHGEEFFSLLLDEFNPYRQELLIFSP